MSIQSDSGRSTFRLRDSAGRTYTVREIVDPGSDGHTRYETTDGYAVKRLDRMSFVIEKRNPATREPRIEATLVR